MAEVNVVGQEKQSEKLFSKDNNINWSDHFKNIKKKDVGKPIKQPRKEGG